jgi:hypothetical protein
MRRPKDAAGWLKVLVQHVELLGERPAPPLGWTDKASSGGVEAAFTEPLRRELVDPAGDAYLAKITEPDWKWLEQFLALFVFHHTRADLWEDAILRSTHGERYFPRDEARFAMRWMWAVVDLGYAQRFDIAKEPWRRLIEVRIPVGEAVLVGELAASGPRWIAVSRLGVLALQAAAQLVERHQDILRYCKLPSCGRRFVAGGKQQFCAAKCSNVHRMQTYRASLKKSHRKRAKRRFGQKVSAARRYTGDVR